MASVSPIRLDRLFVTGVSYKKAGSMARGRFAIDAEHYLTLLDSRRRFGIEELFVLSTCNRSELYAVAADPAQVRNALCTATAATPDELDPVSYSYQGHHAVRHLFRVASGVDSQLLGDYEIVSQLKQGVRTAKENNGIGVFFDRLASEAMKASKAVRSSTAIGSGTVSMAFAAARYIGQVPGIAEKRILLVGTGKIGRSAAKHLAKRSGAGHITMMNRTDATAEAFAAELGVASAPFDELDHALSKADVVLLATNAPEPLVTTANVGNLRPQWHIDLSVPRNVHPAVASLPGKTVLSVDELSRLTDASLMARKAELPKAEALINEAVGEFAAWCILRERLNVLAEVKLKLEAINTNGFRSDKYAGPACTCDDEAQMRIQRVLKNMAVNLRQRNDKGCQYLTAINAFIGTA